MRLLLLFVGDVFSAECISRRRRNLHLGAELSHPGCPTDMYEPKEVKRFRFDSRPPFRQA